MANHISAIKRHRQSEQKQTFNRWWKSRVRSANKSLLEAVESGDKKQADSLLISAIREIDKASSKGVYHKKTASRKIARLSKKVSALS
ncbi:MAG: 30S ribosomal protein S20 [Deltaproteobacteria bacterium]|nr:30S ribosomal protein S20 [Deltaproteobacteria bacterium]